jgi:hypothetical protein
MGDAYRGRSKGPLVNIDKSRTDIMNRINAA